MSMLLQVLAQLSELALTCSELPGTMRAVGHEAADSRLVAELVVLGEEGIGGVEPLVLGKVLVQVAEDIVISQRDETEGALVVGSLHDHQHVPGQPTLGCLVLVREESRHLCVPEVRGVELLEVRGGIDVLCRKPCLELQSCSPRHLDLAVPALKHFLTVNLLLLVMAR